MREHPILPVTEDLQYRAIGLVRGIYRPDNTKVLSRGSLLINNEVQIEAVVLGRMIYLMKRHIDLKSSHLWVVYPRSRDTSQLHFQISGIWEPSTLSKNQVKKISNKKNGEIVDQLIEGDDYFSIRGELIYTKPEQNELVVKIRQSFKSNGKKNAPFKLRLKGTIPLEQLRHFVNLDVRRINQELHIENYNIISPMKTRGGSSKKNTNKYKK